MPTLPPVSVIVAAHNAERTIARCIASLLFLDYPDYEIIVVDNNSTDKTADIIKRYNVKYLFEAKKGWPAARNSAIACSKNRYVANVDSDAFASREWLNILMSKMLDHEKNQVACVVGRLLVEEGKTMAERYYSESDPFYFEHRIGEEDFIPWGGGNNVMIREYFLKAGGYDSDRFKSGADMEFHFRLEKEFGYKTISEPSALVYHEARGTVKQFLSVAAKYSHDGFLRSRTKEMKGTAGNYKYFLVRKFFQIGKNLLGIGWRVLKMLVGKETWFRVVSPYFTIVTLMGTIYGHCKARLELILGVAKV